MEKVSIPSPQLFIIRITDNSLSFALRNAGGGDIEYEVYNTRKGVSVAANLREAFRKSQLLRLADTSVRVVTDAPVLLIPVDEYDDKEATVEYTYVFPSATGCIPTHAVLPSLKSVAQFSVGKDLNTVLCDHFDTIRFEPLMLRLWEFLQQRSVGGNNKKLYAYFHENEMEVCSFSRSKFLFSNRFTVRNSHDALYFLLGVWKQIGGNANCDDLFLAGDIAYREELTTEAKQFLRRVYFINPSADFNRATFTTVEGMPLDMMVQFK